MDRSFKLVISGVLLSTSMSFASVQEFQPEVIYGEDNRLDLYQVSDPVVLDLADSTVAMIPAERLYDNKDATYKVLEKAFKDEFSLCSSEKFYEQKVAANCSGFLVAPNKVATAGHCIKDYSDCLDNKFVFGYGLTEKDKDLSTMSAAEVYSCSKVISSVYEGNGLDYALIELDRPVQGHKPLKMNLTGSIDNNTPLFVIGHPSGLPTKVSGGANVRKSNNVFFVSNLDTYGGNSGSPVFNAKTLDVEGILVRGEWDYVYAGSCKVSNICSDSGCRGEDSTKVSILKSFLN